MAVAATEADWQYAKYMPALDDGLKSIVTVAFEVKVDVPFSMQRQLFNKVYTCLVSS